jgi:hypothetical protein
MLGFELVPAIPLILVAIYAVYEHGLPRHPRAAKTALVLLAIILVADIGCLIYHLAHLPFSD